MEIGDMRLPFDTASDAERNQSRTASLTFTTQSNGIENKVICNFIKRQPLHMRRKGDQTMDTPLAITQCSFIHAVKSCLHRYRLQNPVGHYRPHHQNHPDHIPDLGY